MKVLTRVVIWSLEIHIQTYHDTARDFECDRCGKKFILKWRLKKHQRSHENQSNKKCHYFNNKKVCPFENLGCMFDHVPSGICKYGKVCSNKLCQFQHESSADVESEQDVEKAKANNSFKCEDCDFSCEEDTVLDNHMDEIHEEWRVTQSFCDYFCRGEHGIHICWSNEDFEEYKGFDIWKTATNFDSKSESESIYKCLKCKKVDEDIDNMKEHILTTMKMRKHQIAIFVTMRTRLGEG
jgi:DNA-directed RNA polymerase subunit RPC12/RpoP